MTKVARVGAYFALSYTHLQKGGVRMDVHCHDNTYLRNHWPEMAFQWMPIARKLVAFSISHILMLVTRSHFALPCLSYPAKPTPAQLLMLSASIHTK